MEEWAQVKFWGPARQFSKADTIFYTSARNACELQLHMWVNCHSCPPTGMEWLECYCFDLHPRCPMVGLSTHGSTVHLWFLSVETEKNVFKLWLLKKMIFVFLLLGFRNASHILETSSLSVYKLPIFILVLWFPFVTSWASPLKHNLSQFLQSLIYLHFLSLPVFSVVSKNFSSNSRLCKLPSTLCIFNTISLLLGSRFT